MLIKFCLKQVSFYVIIKSAEGGMVMWKYATIQTGIQILRMIFDIVLMWILLYYTIKIVRNNSRTIQIFKGIILVLVVRFIATFFGFRTVAWMADMFVTWGFLAVIIIFQPEIRSLLEKLGKTSVFTRMSTLTGSERERLVEEVVDAAMQLSSEKIGALITIEQSQSLVDYIRTGSPMNSMVSSDLLRSIFITSGPLHDGAVIIQGDRISCASAYFPPTSMELPTRYGARHRAAIGISEITDSVTIVVSEETGRISIAEEGTLTTVNQKKLREYLNKVIMDAEFEFKIEPEKTRWGVFTPKAQPEVEVETAVEPPVREASAPTLEPKVKKESILKRVFKTKPKTEKQVEPTEQVDPNHEIMVIEKPKRARVSKPKDKEVTQPEDKELKKEKSKEATELKQSKVEVKPDTEQPKSPDELLDSVELEFSEEKNQSGGDQS